MNTIKNKKASSLILVMVITAVVSLGVALLFRLKSFQITTNQLESARIKAKFTARTVASWQIYYTRLPKSDDSLKIFSHERKKYLPCATDVNEQNILASRKAFKSQKRMISAKCFSAAAAKYQLSYIEARQDFHDFLLTHRGDYFAANLKSAQTYYFGPLLLNGNLLVRGGGHHFFNRPNWQSRSILSGGQIFSEYSEIWRQNKDKNEGLAIQQLANPNLIGQADFNMLKEYPLSRVFARQDLELEPGQKSSYLQTMLDDIFLLDYASVADVSNQARQFVDSNFKIDSYATNLGRPAEVVNPYLLKKKHIGSGNNNRRSFGLPFGHQGKRVYIHPLNKSQQGNLHPIADLDGEIGKDFTIEKNNLILKKETEDIHIRLPSEAFSEAGSIFLRGNQYSFLARSREFSEIRLSYLGLTRRLYDTDFHYDPTFGKLTILRSEIVDAIWPKVGVTDGVRNSFDAAINQAAMVYIGGKQINARVVPQKIYIDGEAPRANQVIQVLFTPPQIILRKKLPKINEGIFIDQSVKVIRIDLDQVYPFPDFGVIYSEKPLLLRGNLPRKLSIFCDQDVYLENINEKNPNGHILAVITPGKIWGYRNKDRLVLNNVILFSGADSFTIIDQDDDLLSGGSVAPELSFHGSIHFLNQLKNLYLFPQLDLSAAYYYNVAGSRSRNYFYSEDLQQTSLLPNFMPHSVKILHRQY